LAWYERRGFAMEESVIEGYYRTLRPTGAKLVRRTIGVRDWLNMDGKSDTGMGRSGEGKEVEEGQETSGGKVVD